MVAAAVGVGSFTGARIGLATSLGLKKAFDCRLVRVPLLKSLARSFAAVGDVLAAVCINEREVGRQMISTAQEPSPPQISPFEEFLGRYHELVGEGSAVFSRKLYKAVRRSAGQPLSKVIADAGDNLSRFVGEWALKNAEAGEDVPVYSSGFRFKRS